MDNHIRKNKGIIIFCTLFIGLVAAAVGGILWMSGSQYAVSVYDPNSHINYSNATYELVETGESYETVLKRGTYKVGVHIPEGKYSIELLSGDGRLVLTDDKNRIYLDSQVRQNGEEETTGSISDKNMQDIRLYKGMLVELYSYTASERSSEEAVALKFTTKNAQLPLAFMENPNTESFIISGITVVGVDIPEGSYDFICLSGNGYVELSQGDEKEWEELLEAGKLTEGLTEWKENMIASLNSLRQYEMSTEICNSTFKNVVLAEKTVIELPEGMELRLVPSKVIESEEYGEFYVTE